MLKIRREGLSYGRPGKMPKVFTAGVFLFLLIGAGVGPTKQAEAGLADHVVINEVSIEGAASAGGSYDDWVEFYNPTGQAVNLDRWSLQKATAGGGISASEKVVFSNKTIAAKGFLLVVKDSATTTPSLKDKADVLNTSINLAANNTIFLVNGENDITGSSSLNIVDYVGWGTALYREGDGRISSPFTSGRSIARVVDGEDTDQNSLDFQVLDFPTPNSATSSGNNLGGTVLLTITPDATPAQNISSTGARIMFSLNAAGSAYVKYGLTTAYASSTAPEAVAANATTTISLTGLACAATYHYVIYAENSGNTENDTTSDAIFTTLPCGISLDSLAMTKSWAKANNNFNDGWQWEFNITVWNLSETTLKMKFNQWTGAGVLDAGSNMQFSADNGAVWHDIMANAAYPAAGADISGADNGAGAGRQVKIIVRMKVPVGTVAGYYSSSYGILTE